MTSSTSSHVWRGPVMPSHHSVTADHSLTHTASSDDYGVLSHISQATFTLARLILSQEIGFKLCLAETLFCILFFFFLQWFTLLHVTVELKSLLVIMYCSEKWCKSDFFHYWKEENKGRGQYIGNAPFPSSPWVSMSVSVLDGKFS